MRAWRWNEGPTEATIKIAANGAFWSVGHVNKRNIYFAEHDCLCDAKLDAVMAVRRSGRIAGIG